MHYSLYSSFYSHKSLICSKRDYVVGSLTSQEIYISEISTESAQESNPEDMDEGYDTEENEK